MLTFFSTAKPFRGHSGIIQRNALQSWKLLHADVEVILFGNDDGAAEVCTELGLRHEPEMPRTRLGAPRANSIFARAQEIARHDVFCYSNCDIVLTKDFCRALERILPWQDAFLMVGCRWDTDITEPIDFSDPGWETRIVSVARTEGFRRFYYNIDYFAFKGSLYRNMPELAVGRAWWDHWMIGRALKQGAPVVDATEVVCAVHQNHDYSNHPQGLLGTWTDEDAQRNGQIAGRDIQRTIEDSTYRLTETEIHPNRFHWLAPAKRRIRAIRKAVRDAVRTRLWHPFLDLTRAWRHSLGLREDKLAPLRRKKADRRHWQDR